MKHYPSESEQDHQGVCVKCGRMSRTKIIDILEDQAEVKRRRQSLRKSRAFLEYLGLGNRELDDEEDEEPAVDFREVTRCCGSEDFIPRGYAVFCKKCESWYDERRGKNCGCQESKKS